jgi:hypothetical protein
MAAKPHRDLVAGLQIRKFHATSRGRVARRGLSFAVPHPKRKGSDLAIPRIPPGPNSSPAGENGAFSMRVLCARWPSRPHIDVTRAGASLGRSSAAARFCLPLCPLAVLIKIDESHGGNVDVVYLYCEKQRCGVRGRNHTVCRTHDGADYGIGGKHKARSICGAAYPAKYVAR